MSDRSARFCLASVLGAMLVLVAVASTAEAGLPTDSEDLGTKGDVDCSRLIDVVDALALARFVANLDVSQQQPCLPIDSPRNIVADVSCDGEIDAVDSMVVLRYVAGLPANSPTCQSSIGEPFGFIAVDNFLIDMDPGGTPGNTDASIGTVETCARINENDVLDADEEDIDALDADIVAGPLGFPADHRLIGFEFELQYPHGVSVIDVDLALLLAQGGNAAIFEAFVDPLPDSDGSLRAGALDVNSNTPGNDGDTGPGALARLRLASNAGQPAGVGELRIAATTDGVPAMVAVDHNGAAVYSRNMVDTGGDGLPDTVAEVAQLATGMECPADPLP